VTPFTAERSEFPEIQKWLRGFRDFCVDRSILIDRIVPRAFVAFVVHI
jgi:hypothetical protein